jgi:hypothetical protein
MRKVVKQLRLAKTVVKYLTVDTKDPQRGELGQVVGGDSRYPACPTTHVADILDG